MKECTLCYLEKDGKYLMLYRNKKKNDPNKGKWIGVGGKLEKGETPDMCLVREVKEETGLTLNSFRKRGIVDFVSDEWEPEIMHLYTSDDFTGTVDTDCNEGDLKWIEIKKVPELPLWEGDRIFLEKLTRNEPYFEITLHYTGEKLTSVSQTRELGYTAD